jgi:hypothetical protein
MIQKIHIQIFISEYIKLKRKRLVGLSAAAGRTVRPYRMTVCLCGADCPRGSRVLKAVLEVLDEITDHLC